MYVLPDDIIVNICSHEQKTNRCMNTKMQMLTSTQVKQLRMKSLSVTMIIRPALLQSREDMPNYSNSTKFTLLTHFQPIWIIHYLTSTWIQLLKHNPVVLTDILCRFVTLPTSPYLLLICKPSICSWGSQPVFAIATFCKGEKQPTPVPTNTAIHNSCYVLSPGDNPSPMHPIYYSVECITK